VRCRGGRLPVELQLRVGDQTQQSRTDARRPRPTHAMPCPAFCGATGTRHAPALPPAIAPPPPELLRLLVRVRGGPPDEPGLPPTAYLSREISSCRCATLVRATNKSSIENTLMAA
jgi:hypothetical protein